MRVSLQFPPWEAVLGDIKNMGLGMSQGRG